MEIIAGIIFGIIFFLVINELVSFNTYGWFIKEEVLDRFFDKNLSKYEVNECAYPKPLFYGGSLPFIAKSCFPVSSMWYINNYGRIPRWSKWCKRLSKTWEELPKPRKESLEKYL